MSCAEVEPELEPWVRGELPAREAAAVKAHVAGCEACREAARWLGPLARRLEALPLPPGDEVDADALADRVLARARGKAPRPPLPTAGQLALAAARDNERRAAVRLLLGGVIALGFLLGPTLYRALRPSPPPPPLPDLEALRERARTALRPPPATELAPPATEPAPATEPVPTSEAPLPPPGDLTQAPATEPAPTPAPGTEVAAAPRRGRAARADRLVGEARVRRAGAEGWSPLAAGDLLGEGDEVEALRGPLDMALFAALAGGPGETTAADERAAGLQPTDRLVLAAGARATLGARGARLEAGEVLLSGADLPLLAGAARVDVRGDAALLLDERGRLQVAVLAGRAELQGQALTLEARQRVAVDARGKPGKVGPGPDAPPAWAAEARRLPGRRLAGTGAGPGALPLALGEPGSGSGAGDVVGRGVATPTAPTPQTRAVTVGTGLPEGAWRHAPGSTLRVVFRLAAPANLGVTLRDVTRGQDLQALLRGARPGVWTTLDVDLDALRGAADRALRLTAGDVLDLVTISSHGEAGPVALEVGEVLVVGP